MSDDGGQAEAGWYPDPGGLPRLRYFDGELWTDHYHDNPPTGVPATPAAPYGVAPGYGGGYGMPQPELSPFEYWKQSVTINYANFSGRARRAEFWWTYLFNFVVIIAAAILGIAILGDAGLVLYALVALGLIVPQLAVGVRRLHDTNKSGWYYFFSLIPIVGGIIMIVFFATDSDRGPNQYGPSPKY